MQSLLQENKILGGSIRCLEVEISLDVMENPRSELLTRVIRGVGVGSRGPKSVSPPQKMKDLEIGLKYGKYLYKLKSV